jgi:tripartite-type tricarboxylate transporter receptor subunit TctC
MRSPTLLLAVLLAAMFPVCAGAQGFPARPVTIVVPFPPGGGTDVIARALAVKLRGGLKQEVIVDNRPGAASLIALNHVRAQPPDGYSLVLMSTTITTLPSLNSNATYSVGRDFTPIAGIARGAMMLVVHTSTGIDSMAALIRHAKEQPGKLTWGLASTLGFDHLGAMRIMKEAGIHIETVGYKGAAPQLLDTVAGRVQIMLGSPGGLAQHFASGTLRPIAVTSPTRMPAFADVPTLVEQGLKDASVEVWFATFGPAGVPRDVATRLNREISVAIQTPELVETMDRLGYRPMPLDVAQTAELAVSNERDWGRLIRSLGIKPE